MFGTRTKRLRRSVLRTASGVLYAGMKFLADNVNIIKSLHPFNAVYAKATADGVHNGGFRTCGSVHSRPGGGAG